MTAPRANDESFAALFEQSVGSHALPRRFHAGDSLEVTIVAVGRDAVFADLGAKQGGFFERAELSDAEGRVRVEVGSRVTAVVDSVDSETGQARLRPVSIRGESGEVSAATVSPRASGPVLAEGARIKGAVTGVERYGVFVQIAGTHGRSGRGLVPVSETATPRGADLKKHFIVGQEVEAKILNIDETGKIRLSISALGADDERGVFEAYKSGAPQPAGQSATPTAPGGKPEKPQVRGFGTLADLLPKGIAAAPKAPAPAPAPAIVERGRPRLAANVGGRAESSPANPSSRNRPPRGR